MPQTELCIQDYLINKDKDEMEWDDTINGELNEEDEVAEYDKYYRPQKVYLCNMNGWYYHYKNKRYIVRWIMFDRNGTSFKVNID
jgi:hypothetical protein